MRLRNIPGAEEIVRASSFVQNNPEEYRGSWKSLFQSPSSPLHIEIGMGKGRFLSGMAEKNPGINYIGIEKYTSVLLQAVKRMEKADPAPENLLFLLYMAENLEKVFSPGEVDRIYLNFSDPWPKDRHHKRRLTSREHFSEYQKYLSPKGQLEFKTDNEGLFDFSLEEIPAAGWELLAVTRDLHRDPMGEGNIMTEYEERFSSLGQPIFKLIARPKLYS